MQLHATPRHGDVLREQIRIVGLGLRREALAALVVIGIVSVVIGAAIVRGNAETWFDSDEWVQLGYFAFFYPFLVWRRDQRFGPAFLWTLPVDRRRLALARVCAGWVWLMAALAVFVGWQFVLAILSRVPGAEGVSPFAFIGATAAYLFGSALVLALRHPMRWLLAAVAVFVLLGAVNERVDALLSSSGLPSAMDRAAAYWQTVPALAQPALASFLSIGAGLIALWIAAGRHAEQRRH